MRAIHIVLKQEVHTDRFRGGILCHWVPYQEVCDSSLMESQVTQLPLLDFTVTVSPWFRIGNLLQSEPESVKVPSYSTLISLIGN